MSANNRAYMLKTIFKKISGHISNSIKLTTISILLSGCTNIPKSSEWANKSQALQNDKIMEARGMMPASIDCMMDTTAKNPRPTYFVKITYKPRPPNTHWRWGVGEEDEMRVYANTATREGLKRAQNRHMLDPNSGKKASCSLWQS